MAAAASSVAHLVVTLRFVANCRYGAGFYPTAPGPRLLHLLMPTK